MTHKLENHGWRSAVTRMRERLCKNNDWYPIPSLLSVGLVLLLCGQIIPDLNPRLGSFANIIQYPSERENEGAIWIGIFPEKDKIVVTTADKKRFSWPLALNSKEDILPFEIYLRGRVKKEIHKAALSLQTNLTKISAVLAVDQRLKYYHLRPIIYALAQAKITHYGFETRMITQ